MVFFLSRRRWRRRRRRKWRRWGARSGTLCLALRMPRLDKPVHSAACDRALPHDIWTVLAGLLASLGHSGARQEEHGDREHPQLHHVGPDAWPQFEQRRFGVAHQSPVVCIVCRARQSVRVRRGRGGTAGVEQLRAEWQGSQQLARRAVLSHCNLRTLSPPWWAGTVRGG